MSDIASAKAQALAVAETVASMSTDNSLLLPVLGSEAMMAAYPNITVKQFKEAMVFSPQALDRIGDQLAELGVPVEKTRDVARPEGAARYSASTLF